MNRTQSLVFGAAVVAAMFVGGVIGAAALARSLPVSAAVGAAASPSPGQFHSNEDATHEKGESAAHETAESNGTFRPGGGGFGPGQSNETSTHETGESATREAGESTAKASASATK